MSQVLLIFIIIQCYILQQYFNFHNTNNIMMTVTMNQHSFSTT